jgi:hypothetical protein
MSRGFQIVLASLALLVTGAALGFLHLQNVQLRRRLERQHPVQQQAAQLREENTRLRALAVGQTQNAQAAVAAVRGQIEQARNEIAALEKAAAAQRAEAAARAARDADALVVNRDPMTGLTRLEHFRDLGQGTPVAAFETMVHAALRGDEAALARLFTMPPATRAQADALLSRLPEEARARWTPEKLATLWVTGALTELPALQITGQRFEDAEEAVVTFRAPQFERDEKVNLKLTRDGWKIVVGTGMIGNLEKKLGARPPASR